MYPIHTYHLSHPALRSARFSLAAGAVAGLIVLAACTDAGTTKVTAPGPRAATIGSGGLANPGVIQACATGAALPFTAGYLSGGQVAAGQSLITANTLNHTLLATSGTISSGGCFTVYQSTASDGASTDSYAQIDINITVPVGFHLVSTTCTIDLGLAQADGTPYVNGDFAPDCDNDGDAGIWGNFYHGTSVNFVVEPDQIAAPVLFVIGDQTNHGTGDIVYFWGAQWWKNNPMSLFSTKGWESFKGFAGTVNRAPVTGGPCGTFNSRVGNSPPPPATIPDLVGIIVTDKITKDGPGESGKILQILIVDSDGNYAPNPGHIGRGAVVSIECGGA